MVQYTKIDANRCVLKPFWGVLEAFWGKNGVFWGDFRVGRRGFWIEKWDERGDGRWDSGEKSWWTGDFFDYLYLCKISPMPGLPFFSIFGGFSFAFVAPCRRLAYIVYLVSRCFWRRLSCYAFIFPDFSNYSFYFNNPLNSFQYYILQLSTLHHYHAFTLYIPTIHNFSLYHTLSLLSPPFILSSSLLSFLYTSTTLHAFLYVLLVQLCKAIIIYIVQ